MKEFFENLKQKRLEKNISLEEIQQKSRLPMAYLQAIETGSMDKLPPGYERIYLRRYAKELGLDGEEVIRDYDMFTGKLSPREEKTAEANDALEKPTIAAAKDKINRNVNDAKNKINRNVNNYTEDWNLDRMHKFFWIGFAVLIVAAAGYFTWDQYIADQNSADLQVTEIPVSKLIEKQQQKENVATQADSMSVIPALNTPPGLNIELYGVVDTTWVGEIKDGLDTTDYFITLGTRHTVRAHKQVEFRLGKANGVEFWLNGKRLGVFRDDSRVANFYINREGLVKK